MLTDLEIERLRDPAKAKPSLLRYSHFVVRNKLKTWLEDIEDVKIVLDKLDVRQLSKIVDSNALFSILDLSERVLAVSDTPTIIDGEYVRVGVVPKNEATRREKRPTMLKDFEYTVRKATPEEKERVSQLKAHIEELCLYLGEEDLIEVAGEALSDSGYIIAKAIKHPHPGRHSLKDAPK